MTLLGATLASADTFEARVRFGRFIGMVSGEENTLFLRAFEALGVTEDRRTADPDAQPTAGFKAIMREAAETRSYATAFRNSMIDALLHREHTPYREIGHRSVAYVLERAGIPYTMDEVRYLGGPSRE